MHRIHIVCALAATLAAASAQGFVVPSKATHWQPGVVFGDKVDDPYLFWGSSTPTDAAARAQYAYDVSDIPVAATTLTGMAVRAPYLTVNFASTFSSSVWLSVGPNPSSSMSSSFAGNHGAGVSQVFTGAVQLPDATSAPWPQPWQAALPFSTPFPYDRTRGSSLVVEFLTTASSSNQTWRCEGYRAEVGQAALHWSQGNCVHSGGGTISGSVGYGGSFVPGGTFQFQMFGYPGATPSLAENVLFLSPDGFGSPVGPFVTPFDLDRVAPSPPNCQWAIGLAGAVTLTMVYGNGGTMFLPPISIPLDAAIGGMSFWSQDLAWDTHPVRGREMLPSAVFRWVVGTGNKVPVSRVYATFDPTGVTPNSGSLEISNGPSIRFD